MRRGILGKRRHARILALIILYQADLRSDEPLDEIIHGTLLLEDYEVEVVNYALKIVHGYYADATEIDRTLSTYADNWSIHRMATVDRNVLRMAIYEFRSEKDVPKNVIINEAIEIAKLYSTEKSGEFVNGILDKVGTILRSDEEHRDRTPDSALPEGKS